MRNFSKIVKKNFGFISRSESESYFYEVHDGVLDINNISNKDHSIDLRISGNEVQVRSYKISKYTHRKYNGLSIWSNKQGTDSKEIFDNIEFNFRDLENISSESGECLVTDKLANDIITQCYDIIENPQKYGSDLKMNLDGDIIKYCEYSNSSF